MALTELDISFSQLRCFVAVVDAGSLAEAGRQLGMSAASVSKAIARLEQSSGMKLLHRSTHSISLAQAGEQLVEPAREVARAAGVFSRSAGTQTQESAAGWVRVTAPVAFSRCLIRSAQQTRPESKTVLPSWGLRSERRPKAAL
ncbi:MAG: LysR family transcriptional regulator [Gammaproteobacteria bacterium]